MFLAVYCEEHPDVAKSYLNIGTVYNFQGRHKEALEEFEKCLKIQVDKLGHEHLDVAMSYMNIGNVYFAQGKYNEALDYHQKSLQIKITAVGSDHRDVAVWPCRT